MREKVTKLRTPLLLGAAFSFSWLGSQLRDFSLPIAAVLVLSMGCRQRIEVAQSKQTSASIVVEFTDITSDVGITFKHTAAGAGDYFFPAIMGPGGAFLDFDRDGDLDILLVNNPTRDSESSQPSDDPGCRLFRQDDGGRFSDVTAACGVKHSGYGTGVAVGDVDNDGYPDVYLTCYGPDRLFLNRRNGTFVDMTSAGIDNPAWSTSAAFLDFDRDGWLDLYVCNYVDYDPSRPCLTNNGQQDYCNPAQFRAWPHKLFRNMTGSLTTDGVTSTLDQLKFEDVSLSSNIARKVGPGLGVVCGDFTGDNWPDIYVANDGEANFLWVNQRNGRFEDQAVIVGNAYDNLGRAQGSMGIAVGDVNSDQQFDILVTNLDGENNALYLGTKDNSCRDSSGQRGLGPSFPRTGFGTAFVDLENDGDVDLLVANGRVRRVAGPSEQPNTKDMVRFWQLYEEPNDIFANDGDGKFHRYSPSEIRGFADYSAVSRSLAVGDVDNDGDLDLLVTATGGASRVWRNDVAKKGHWLTVSAIDPRWNGREAYGAMVTVVAANRRWRSICGPGASYLCSHDPRLHFGLGEIKQVDRIDVVWPDGTSETFPTTTTDRFVVLQRGNGSRE